MKIEYKTWYYRGNFTDVDLVERLNELGNDGWMVVQTKQWDTTIGMTIYRYLLQRIIYTENT